MNKEEIQKKISNCCNASVKVEGGVSESQNYNPKGQTYYYVCSKCGKPCDIKIPKNMNKEIQLNNIKEKIIKIEKERKDFIRKNLKFNDCDEFDSELWEFHKKYPHLRRLKDEADDLHAEEGLLEREIKIENKLCVSCGKNVDLDEGYLCKKCSDQIDHDWDIQARKDELLRLGGFGEGGHG